MIQQTLRVRETSRRVPRVMGGDWIECISRVRRERRAARKTRPEDDPNSPMFKVGLDDPD